MARGRLYPDSPPNESAMQPGLLFSGLARRWYELRLGQQLAGWRDAIADGLLGAPDLSPFAAALGRARERGHLRLAVLGGSITAGAAATRGERRWPDRVSSWIEQHTGLPVRLVNAGLGATGSELGLLRLDQDVLSHYPDLLVLEFAVNDLGSPHAAACLEGLLRRVIGAPEAPAVALLLLSTLDGASAHDEHLALARHYGLPAASLPRTIEALAARRQLPDPAALWGDAVHPNDLGHGLCAALVVETLERGFAAPSDAARAASLGEPLWSEVFARTRWASGARWVAQGEGFEAGKIGHFGPSLVARAAGAWREGVVEGEAIGVVVSRQRGPAGRLLAAVDEGEPVIVECWQDPDWGGRPFWAIAAEGLAPGPHRLRVAVLSERAAGSEGPEVTLEAVWGAGRGGEPGE